MIQDHIIQKVFFEITVNNKEKAFRIKEDINSFLSMDLFPEIEKYINALEYKLNNQTLQIPRLELNLDVKNSSLNTELKDQIAQLFKEDLSKIMNPMANSNKKTESESEVYLFDNQEKMVQAFIYFLEKGYMPWWNSDRKDIAILEPSVFNNLILYNNFPETIIPILSKQHVQDRIINQLSNEQIVQLCMVILKNRELKINLEADIIHRISKLSHPDKIIVWQLVLKVLSEYLNLPNSNLREYLLQQISKIDSAGLSQTKTNHQNWKTIVEIFPFINENEILESIKNNTVEHSDNEKKLIDAIQTIDENLKLNDGQYIQNAGLILIHPFIKTLFEQCDLLDPKTQQLIDPELCVHLLHYIATGKTNAPEYKMVFEKFLCNIPMNKTINKHIKLSRKHKAQAKIVIQSVQHNWSSMKKSSVELLRNEFFQRPGKLVLTDYDYLLTVERKTQDILLEKLAWGVSLFKLPWHEKYLFVNW